MKRKSAAPKRITNSSDSLEKLEAKQDYEALIANNCAMSKEVAESRMIREVLQTEIYELHKQKFEAQLKLNCYKQIISDIEERSRVVIGKIVESSTEITAILQLISKIKESVYFDSSTSQRKDNLSVIRTPEPVNNCTIQVSLEKDEQRSNDDTKGGEQEIFNHNNESCNNQEEAPVTNNQISEEVLENDKENSPKITFRSRGNTRYPALNSLLLDEEVVEQNEDEEETSSNKSGMLSIIPEEEESLSALDMERSETNESTIVDLFGKVNTKRGSNETAEPELEVSYSTTNATTMSEMILSFIDTQEESRPASITRRSSGTPRRISLIQRKSIGSPIPTKLERRLSIPRRRSSSLRRSLNNSLNMSESEIDCTMKVKTASPLHTSARGCTLDTSLRRSDTGKEIRRTRSNTSSQSITSEGQIAVTPDLKTLYSLIEKSSVHSTPLSGESSHRTNINSRRRGWNANLMPVIRLSRMDMSKIDNISTRKSQTFENDLNKENEPRNMNQIGQRISKRSRENGEKLPSVGKVKEEYSFKRSSKTSTKSRSPSKSRKSPRFVKLEPETEEESDTENIRKRPRRAAVPLSLKEPSLNAKMRRPR